MYKKPEVTRYSGKELLDLMGPVETSYDCDLRVPDTVVCEQAFTVGVDISEVPDFTEALITWRKDDGTLERETVRRIDCSIEDSTWVCNFVLTCSEPLGDWRLTMMLVDGGTASCYEDFTLTD